VAEYLAHSRSKSGRKDTVADHLKSVAKRAAEFAEAFGATDEAYFAGLLHDLGKYGDLFQSRLRGEAEHVDHWSLGAWHSLSHKQQGLAAALVVQGHHVGLQRADGDSLRTLNPSRWEPRMHDQWRLTATGLEPLLARLQSDGLTPSAPKSSLYSHADQHAASTMLDVRMLFSALVDADFIETEAHFNAVGDEKSYRKPGPRLDPERTLEVLLSHVQMLAQAPTAHEEVRQLRARLLSDCVAAAERPQGQFTLTAPTGSGKTLSMLAFALRHAQAHKLRRVVFVIPYLSIIEQTVHVYRELLAKVMGSDYVLENHSLAGTHGVDDGAEGVRCAQRLQAENWDVPIVVTTSVQFLESLFANRPSACRKLHRLAESVILLDEVQTLPSGLAIPTLAVLSRLVERYRTSVVFATATQPAFGHLDAHVRKGCVSGWQPTEITKQPLRLSRAVVTWPRPDERFGWTQLAGMLASDECAQALCVVNLKRHAMELHKELAKRVAEDGLFHLSTNMCPAHRKAVLREVRERLSPKSGRPCRLVSTQCVEAGVDVDFPVVYRAWGPLDSIAQAAGRCNRNGLLPQRGSMHVFVPEDEKYPPGAYEQAASVARILAAAGSLDIDDPALFQAYYRQLYDIARPAERNEALTEAIARRDFVEVARLYRLIEKDAVNVLVPYDVKLFVSLVEEARGGYGITRDWVARARPHAVSLYRPEQNALVTRLATAAETGSPDDWWVLSWNRGEKVSDYYDPKTGLVHKATEGHWIA